MVILCVTAVSLTIQKFFGVYITIFSEEKLLVITVIFYGHDPLLLRAINKQGLKITLEKFDLILYGHNSVTKNAKNNPKVPKFSSCGGLSSTLSRKCGKITLCGCSWVLEVSIFVTI